MSLFVPSFSVRERIGQITAGMFRQQAAGRKRERERGRKGEGEKKPTRGLGGVAKHTAPRPSIDQRKRQAAASFPNHRFGAGPGRVRLQEKPLPIFTAERNRQHLRDAFTLPRVDAAVKKLRRRRHHKTRWTTPKGAFDFSPRNAAILDIEIDGHLHQTVNVLGTPCRVANRHLIQNNGPAGKRLMRAIAVELLKDDGLPAMMETARNLLLTRSGRFTSRPAAA